MRAINDDFAISLLQFIERTVTFSCVRWHLSPYGPRIRQRLLYGSNGGSPVEQPSATPTPTSYIFGVLAAPATPKTIPEGRGLRPPSFGMLFGAAGAARTPKSTISGRPKKTCIKNPSVWTWLQLMRLQFEVVRGPVGVGCSLVSSPFYLLSFFL